MLSPNIEMVASADVHHSHHLMLFFPSSLSCSDVLLLSKVPVGYSVQAWYIGCHNQPYSKLAMSKVCVWVCVFSGWKIRPQKMLIRVDLGTWSCCLMDRVQGQTSPWGAMILSLIVHTDTHTHAPPLPCWPYTSTPTHTHSHMLTHTPLLYTHHRQNKFVSDTTGGKKEDGSRRWREAWGSKGESSAWRRDGGACAGREEKHTQRDEKNQYLVEVSLYI